MCMGGDDITGRAPSIFTSVYGGIQATHFSNLGRETPPTTIAMKGFVMTTKTKRKVSEC